MTFLDHRQLSHQNVNFNSLLLFLVIIMSQNFKEKALSCSFIDPEGWDGEGGGRGDWDGEHM